MWASSIVISTAIVNQMSRVQKVGPLNLMNLHLYAWQYLQVNFLTDDTKQKHRRLVFQFGVLLLELITGQSLFNEAEIVQWIQESGFAYSIHKMVDTDLGDSYDSKELQSLLIIARLCTKTENDTLISIPQILRYLQGRLEHSAL